MNNMIMSITIGGDDDYYYTLEIENKGGKKEKFIDGSQPGGEGREKIELMWIH